MLPAEFFAIDLIELFSSNSFAILAQLALPFVLSELNFFAAVNV